jgi:hypothetical protein
MGHLSPERLLAEWTRAADMIASVLGHGIEVASVPGGDFTPAVAAAAAQAGHKELFTSEPTVLDRELHGVLVHGRFTIRRWTRSTTAAGLASGRYVPRAQQALAWSVRKAAKRVAGDRYLQVRRRLLGQQDVVCWGDSHPAEDAR